LENFRGIMVDNLKNDFAVGLLRRWHDVDFKNCGISFAAKSLNSAGLI
jgi:hypothetical protein